MIQYLLMRRMLNGRRDLLGPLDDEENDLLVAGGIGALILIVMFAMGIGLWTWLRPARPDHATVDHWADGDTLTVVQFDHTRLTVRLEGIDAPELRRSSRTTPQCNDVAMAEAAEGRANELAPAGATVVVRISGKDRFGRSVAKVYANGRDVSAQLLAEGHAVRWPLPAGVAPCPTKTV